MLRGRMRYVVEMFLMMMVVTCYVSQVFESDRGAPQRMLAAAIVILWVFYPLLENPLGKLLLSQAARKFDTLSSQARRALRATGHVAQALWWVVVISSTVLWLSHAKEMRHIVLELMVLAAGLRGASVGLAQLCANHARLDAVE